MNTVELFDQTQSAAACRRRTLTLTVIACLLAAGIVASFAVASARAEDKDPAPASGERNVLPLEHDGPVKAVFQVTKDEMKGGAHKGLFALKKMHEEYVKAGIDPKRIDLRAVYHGDAADHLLTDEAWNRWRKVTGGNPNTQILAELKKLGVSIELCDSRRRENEWSKDDVHPDVLLTPNAYQRLIDLQLRGYAYVRF